MTFPPSEVRTHRGYPTVRDYWLRFYRDDPDLYDRFALSSVHAVAEMVAGGVKRKDAARMVADLSGWPQRDVYRLAVDAGDTEG